MNPIKRVKIRVDSLGEVMRSVELFAGAGGLALGMSNAGFTHSAVIEWDLDACNTFRYNQLLHTQGVDGWPIHQVDIREFKYQGLPGDLDVVSGGPPCQPFSLGGKHRGSTDNRNMFPEAVRAVRELMPRAFIFENVKGLLRQTFSDYFDYIILQLEFPKITVRPGETWQDHCTRLQRQERQGRNGPEYRVEFRLLNAANFGVPQKRERVFIVGFRRDVLVPWTFPQPTHSHLALQTAKWVTGDYWEPHGVSAKDIALVRERENPNLTALRNRNSEKSHLPWVTVRDALLGLPDPEGAKKTRILNHEFNPGARSYPGHTGSPLDEPAKTLKAGGHGVPGGENMLTRPDGSVRYFTVREAARLQTFPDSFAFQGAWSEAMRQLGNAVPVRLAEVVTGSVRKALLTT